MPFSVSASTKFSEIDEVQLKSFVCHSVPIATRARANHVAEMRLLRQPWWRKLGDEYQDTKYEEDNVNNSDYKIMWPIIIDRLYVGL